MSINIARFIPEARRAVRNNKHEMTDDGRVFIGGGANVFIGGHATARYAPPGGEFGPRVIGPNRIVNEGLNFVLNLLGQHVSPLALYLAPFTGNVTPAANWTGANFAANASEFTAYTAANRLPWTTVSANAQQLTNVAALSTATITLSAGGPYTIRGLGLLGASGKGATTGPLIVAARFPDDLSGLAAGGRLGLQYDLDALDEGDA
ncbi:MAG: hypothetical protein GX856_04400 [Gammaproteobacteria bacterium]|jgi:hypothetical protein|nr:hypothetical protein [Gammaproteobacteria bacterium]